MTATAPQTASRSPMLGILALGVLAVAGAAIGAYLDWRMWHPSSGIVVTAGAILLLLVGALAWASRWRPVRPLAFGLLAFGIGVILGQNLGPSRPPVTVIEGTITIELSEPADAAVITGPATCQLTPDGDNFEITADPNLRLQIGDQRLEERDPIQVAMARGDMWDYGAESRSDGWSLLVIVGDAGPFTGEEGSSERAVATHPSSELTATGDQRAGSMTFAGLVEKDVGLGLTAAGPLDLSGTLRWTCEGDPVDPER
ncbi:MAG TPA: hypothetical protein VF365_12305 [Candidatus Limnocylindria bacterium]